MMGKKFLPMRLQMLKLDKTQIDYIVYLNMSV